MRIQLVTDWNRGQGGAENYISLLRDRLRAAGDDARLLTSSAGSAGDGTADYVGFGTERAAAQTFLQIANPFAFARVRQARREFQPQVAFVNMFARHLSPTIFDALEGVPTILFVSDYKCVCPIGSKLLPNESLCQVEAGWVCCRNGCVNALHWLRDQPRYALIRSRVRRVHRVLACSEYLQAELARNGIAADVVLLPVADSSTTFQRCPAADPVFAFSGRLDREKGVGLLLRAFARLHSKHPTARLKIIGRGPLRLQLEKEAASLGLTNAVEFCGWLSMPEIEAKMSEAWALVVPSLWAEPLGFVALEAILRGMPVIASATGGLAEIVEEGVSGLLFPNNDEEALVARLEVIASGKIFPDHSLPDEVVRRTSEKFNLERHVAFMRRIFREVAGDSVVP